MPELPSSKYTLKVLLVKTNERPIFDKHEKPPRAIYSVTKDDLQRIKTAVDGKTVTVTAYASQVDKELAKEVLELVDKITPKTAVRKMFTRGSEPYGKEWEPTEEKIVHPSRGGTDVCVSLEGTAIKSTWYQLAVKATKKPTTGGVIYASFAKGGAAKKSSQ